MLITSQTLEQRTVRNSQNRKLLALNTELYIRQSFNAALQSIEAESWIEIAQEKGLIDLAVELKNDLAFITTHLKTA